MDASTKSSAHRMSSIGVSQQKLQAILDGAKEHSLGDLYPWQIRAIDNTLAGRDTIVIAATGSGKSRCFQDLQFITPNGTVLVISPLTALMDNQVNLPLVYSIG